MSNSDLFEWHFNVKFKNCNKQKDEFKFEFRAGKIIACLLFIHFVFCDWLASIVALALFNIWYLFHYTLIVTIKLLFHFYLISLFTYFLFKFLLIFSCKIIMASMGSMQNISKNTKKVTLLSFL